MITKTKIAALATAALLATGGLALANGRGGGHKRMSKEERRAHHAEMLKKYDANQDGKLDDAEREKLHAEKAAEKFKQLDTNGDGVLSFDEFKQARPPHPPPPRDDER